MIPAEPITDPILMPDNRELQRNAASNPSPDNIHDAVGRLKIQDKREGSEGYTDRHSVPDCNYFLRTGSCGYGSNCRYNHPTYAGPGQGAQFRGELPERVGQPDCQYFLKTGTCKFGATCKYHHPRDKHDARPVSLNMLGLPMRQDEKSCPYYMRTGSCKFGMACKFNHPQPAMLGAALPITGPSTHGSAGFSMAPPSGLPLIGGFSAWPLPRPPYMSSPQNSVLPAYMPIVFPPSQGTMPVQQSWSTYMGNISHVPSTDVLGSTQMTNSTHPPQPGSNAQPNLPERPDQPECHYYMKTGSCKYGTKCKYHHPKERNSLATCMLGPFGLPLRPGQGVCTFYSMYGSCNYGSACKYDHPFVGYYNNSLPAASISDPSAFSNQRNSQMVRATADGSPSKMSRPPDRLTKTETTNDVQDSDNKAHETPQATSLSEDTVPSSESPLDHSD